MSIFQKLQVYRLSYKKVVIIFANTDLRISAFRDALAFSNRQRCTTTVFRYGV